MCAKKIFFIPGMMGSVLHKKIIGENGEYDTEVVWGDDILKNMDLLGVNPEKIANINEDNILVVDVIREMKLSHIKKYSVYNKIIQFCTSSYGLGLKENYGFFVFPYDWRKDNSQIAKLFADFIRSNCDLSTDSIIIIAHSMGGIVSHLMLVENDDIHDNIKLYFQIASPIEGSVKAYYTLKKNASFNWVCDYFWNLHHHIDPTVRHRLLSVLSEFDSLYQLLPHESVRPLYGERGEQYSAMDEKIWGDKINKIKAAKKVHKHLRKKLKCKMCCVYSERYETEMFYRVNEYFNIETIGMPPARGDKIVVSASAIANSGKNERLLIKSRKSRHDQICSNSKVLLRLKIMYDQIEV